MPDVPPCRTRPCVPIRDGPEFEPRDGADGMLREGALREGALREGPLFEAPLACAAFSPSIAGAT